MTKTVPERASVVVIGGGVIGTSIAYHLASSGVSDVVLVERDELACGSTCRAAGGVRASFSNPANIEIGLRGLEVYSTFADKYDQEIDFTPDGYLYTWSTDRLWRKNRRRNVGSTCRGVDSNRNWGYQWGSDNGSSGAPCRR